MTDQNEVIEQIKKTIKELLGLKKDRVLQDTDDLGADLGADSLDLVELIMTFEEIFTTEITDEDAENLTTVGKCVDYAIAKNFTL